MIKNAETNLAGSQKDKSRRDADKQKQGHDRDQAKWKTIDQCKAVCNKTKNKQIKKIQRPE